MYTKDNDIRYGFPKGKIEFWETTSNTAIREVNEEDINLKIVIYCVVW